MSDITEVLTQDAIADSLLGEPQEQAPSQPEPSNWSRPGIDLLNEAIEDQQHNVEAYGDAVRMLHGDEAGDQADKDLGIERQSQASREQEEDQSWRPQNQPADSVVKDIMDQRAAAAEPLTPQQIRDGLDQLDTWVSKNNLNDPAVAKDLATEFCSALGVGDPVVNGVNADALGNLMVKTGVSAMHSLQNYNGDPSTVAPLHPEAARIFTTTFLKASGITDPRGVQLDANIFANTMFRGAVNFLHTHRSLGGKVNDLTALNNPEMCVFFCQELDRAWGGDGRAPIGRMAAVKLVDALTRPLLPLVARINQMQPPPQQRSRQPRASRLERQVVRPRKMPRFETHTDIFDQATVGQLNNRL